MRSIVKAIRTLALGVAVATLAVGCSSVEVIQGGPTSTFPDDCTVTVYQTEAQAKKRGDIEELCVISGTTNFSFDHTIEGAIARHKGKACACGATSVYVQSRQHAGLGVASVSLVAFRYVKGTKPR